MRPRTSNRWRCAIRASRLSKVTSAASACREPLAGGAADAESRHHNIRTIACYAPLGIEAVATPTAPVRPLSGATPTSRVLGKPASAEQTVVQRLRRHWAITRPTYPTGDLLARSASTCATSGRASAEGAGAEVPRCDCGALWALRAFGGGMWSIVIRSFFSRRRRGTRICPAASTNSRPSLPLVARNRWASL